MPIMYSFSQGLQRAVPKVDEVSILVVLYISMLFHFEIKEQKEKKKKVYSLYI